MDTRFNYRYKKPANGRYFFIFSLFVFAFAFLAIRLFYLQLFEHSRYANIAKSNQGAVIDLPPTRGLILDRNLEKLAMNVPKYSIYAIPRHMSDKKRTAERLSSILNKNKEEILERLSRDKLFIWIDRKVSDVQARAIKEGRMEGLGLIAENERSYPNGALMAHVIGFAGIDNNGLEGIESFYDKELRGLAGHRRILVDAKRRQVSSLEEDFFPPREGYSLVLTIDETIQHIAEKAMMTSVDAYHPASGSVVVMDPYTGGILALCNWPAYNPNNFADSTLEERRNRALTDIIEPGSVFKIVTASAALEEKAATLDDEFFCENGKYFISGKILHDHNPHGILKFKNIIEVSSNIGTVKIAQRLGPDTLYKYIRLFGFNKKTGINLPGEVSGILRPTSQWSRTSMTAIPIGQEVGVTPIQLLCAIAAIGNGGVLLEPRIVDKIIDEKGAIIKEFKPKGVRKVLSEDTCAKMREVLKAVVDTGTGTRAQVVGYSAAGKTGTGQRLEANGSYSHSKFNSVFMGFAPAVNPRIAVVVVFVEPHPYYYGGTVSAPVFSEIVSNTFRYLRVTPDGTVAKLCKPPLRASPKAGDEAISPTEDEIASLR